MGLAAVTAAALTDHSARYAMLLVAGNDLLLQPGGTQGLRYGVDIASIRAAERGPGGVSELVFVLDDPLKTVALARGYPVRFQQTAGTYPIFQGFISSWTPEHVEGWLGTRLTVRCIGLEAVLDWAKLPALTIAASTLIEEAVKNLVANVVNGLAFPLTLALQAPGTISGTPLVIPAGTTLREGLRTVLDDVTAPGFAYTFLMTVDSSGNLRVFISFLATPGDSNEPSDWAQLYINNGPSAPANGDGLTGGTAAVAQDFNYEIDGSGPAAVYVVGAGGLSVLLQDGTGEVGNLAFISDSNLDTVTRAQNAGSAYLGQNVIQARGSFSLDSRAPIYSMRAGTSVNITDTPMGLASRKFRILEIVRSFHGTLEDWEITYGGGVGPASFSAESRRLTRTTLS